MAGRPVMPRRPIVQAHFGPDGRLFYPETFGPAAQRETEDRTEIVSVDLDGRDRQVHVVLNDADEAAVSPDGQRLAFQEGDNVYLMPFPTLGTGESRVRIDKRKRPPAGDADLERGRQLPALARQHDRRVRERPALLRLRHRRRRRRPRRAIKLSLPRPVGKGSVAFTNARILTMDNRKVIERGTLVIKDGRISCVGTCCDERRRQGDRREGQDDHARPDRHARAPSSRSTKACCRRRTGNRRSTSRTA